MFESRGHDWRCGCSFSDRTCVYFGWFCANHGSTCWTFTWVNARFTAPKLRVSAFLCMISFLCYRLILLLLEELHKWMNYTMRVSSMEWNQSKGWMHEWVELSLSKMLLMIMFWIAHSMSHYWPSGLAPQPCLLFSKRDVWKSCCDWHNYWCNQNQVMVSCHCCHIVGRWSKYSQ